MNEKSLSDLCPFFFCATFATFLFILQILHPNMYVDKKHPPFLDHPHLRLSSKPVSCKFDEHFQQKQEVFYVSLLYGVRKVLYIFACDDSECRQLTQLVCCFVLKHFCRAACWWVTFLFNVNTDSLDKHRLLQTITWLLGFHYSLSFMFLKERLKALLESTRKFFFSQIFPCRPYLNKIQCSSGRKWIKPKGNSFFCLFYLAVRIVEELQKVPKRD